MFSLVDRLEGVLHATDIEAVGKAIVGVPASQEDVRRVMTALRGERKEGMLFWAVAKQVSLFEVAESMNEIICFYLNDASDEEAVMVLSIIGSHLVTIPPMPEVALDKITLLTRYCRLLEKSRSLSAKEAATCLFRQIGSLDLSTCDSQVREFAWNGLRILFPLIDNQASFISDVGSLELRVKLAAASSLTAGVTVADCFSVGASATKSTRKAARVVLELQGVVSAPDQEAWQLFWAVQDSMDEYASHLFKELLPKLDQVAVTPWGPLAIQSVMTRCCTHGNDLLLKNAYSALFTSQVVAQALSDDYMLQVVLPSLWSCTAFFSQSAFATPAETFLSEWVRRQVDSSGPLLFLMGNPHAHYGPCIALARALLGCRTAEDHRVKPQVLEFVKVHSRGYPSALRRFIIQALLPVIDRVLIGDSEAVAMVLAFMPDGLCMPESWSVELTALEATPSRGYIASVGLTRLCSPDAYDVMEKVEALSSRLYASTEEKFFQLHALAVEVLRGRVTPSYEACEVCAPAAVEALTRRDLDTLLRFTAVWSVILKGKVTGKFLALAESACSVLSDDKSSFAVKACAGILLHASGVCRTDAAWAAHVVPDGKTLVCNQVVAWGESSLRPLRGFGSNDELLDTFCTRKLEMAAVEGFFPGGLMGWIESLSEAGPNQLEALQRCESSLNLLRDVSDEQVARIGTLVTRLVERRSHAPLNPNQVQALMSFMFNQHTMTASPQVVISVMRKLLFIGTFTPLLSRTACSSFLTGLTSLELKVVFSDLLADICSYREATYELNEEPLHAFTRINMILYLDANPELARSVIACILKHLNAELDSAVRRNAPKCPLPLSESYRMQLRSWQALVVLCKHVTEESEFASIASSVFRHLNSPNQADVKEYQDLVSCFLCKRFPQLGIREYLVPSLLKVNQASQSMASFVITGGYLLQHLSKDTSEFHLLFDSLVPYLTSNGAFLRAQAQYWFWKTREKTAGVSSLVDSLLRYIETQKECISMRKRHAPIYERWDPDQLISSSGLDVLTLHAAYRNGELVPSIPVMVVLKEAVHEEMSVVWRDADEPELACVTSEASEEKAAASYQRKYDPSVNALFPSLTDCDGKKTRRSTDLIVVASFVDKTTNLAGLCRTAEVFGASKLIIENKGIVKDTEFKSMAVTADQWLSIDEVRTSDMKEYLRRLRSEGYRVVGLEQTSTSKMLSDYVWPQRTALVLGSEREGLPVWMMPELDSCVEIPQIGMVRSLNVHVSGALAIWEYNKQHA